MSIQKNFGFNLFNAFLNIAFPIISFPYAARILSPEGIGKTMFIFSFAQYFALIAAFGIPIYGVKMVAAVSNKRQGLRRVTSELFSLSVLVTTVTLVLYYSSILLVPRFQDDLIPFVLAGALVALSIMNVDWYYGGIGKFKWIAMRSLLVKSLSLILLFFIVNTNQDTLGYLIFLIFLFGGNYIISFVFLFRSVKFNFTLLGLKKHLRPLVMIFSMTLATTIYTTLDTVLLGVLSNDIQVGFYTAAVKLSKVAIPIITSLGIVVIPRAMELINRKDTLGQFNLYRKSFSLISFLAVPICVGIFVTSQESILLFSGEAFKAAEVDVQILSLLPLLIGIGHFVAFQILVPFEKYKGMFISTVLGMMVFILLCFSLVPIMGSRGASISNIATELVVSICYLFFVPKAIRQHLPWSMLLKALIATAPFYPITRYVRYVIIQPFPSFSVSIILCALIYLLIQMYLFKNDNVKNILFFLKSKLWRKLES